MEYVKTVSDVGISFISEVAWNDIRIWITLDLLRGHRDIHVCKFVCTQSFCFGFFPLLPQYKYLSDTIWKGTRKTLLFYAYCITTCAMYFL